MATNTSVPNTPHSAPNNGVNWTRTAVDEAISKDREKKLDIYRAEKKIENGKRVKNEFPSCFLFRYEKKANR